MAPLRLEELDELECHEERQDLENDLGYPDFGHHWPAWDFPLSRAEKVRRVLLLFEAEVEMGARKAKVEKAEAETEIEVLKQKAASLAASAARAQRRRTSSPPSTPPTPPPRPRLPRASAPPAPLAYGRRRSSVVVIPGFPSGFDPQEALSSDGECQSGEAVGGGAGVLSSPPPRRLPYTGVVPPFVPGAPSSLLSSALSASPVRGGCLLLSPPPASVKEEDEYAEEYDKEQAREDQPMRLINQSPALLTSALPSFSAELEARMPIAETDTGNGGATGSVAAICWRGAEVVDKLRFIARGEDVAEHERDVAEDIGDGVRSLLQLEIGEYVRALRGRTEAFDGRVADWIQVRTNRRNVLLGKQGIFTPSFSFVADEGHELMNVDLGQRGSIEGARQQPLQRSLFHLPCVEEASPDDTS